MHLSNFDSLSEACGAGTKLTNKPYLKWSNWIPDSLILVNDSLILVSIIFKRTESTIYSNRLNLGTMSMSLKVALKALPYPTLLAVGLVNIQKEVISIDYVNDLSGGDLEFHTGEAKLTSQLDTLNYLGQNYPEVLGYKPEVEEWLEIAVLNLNNKNFNTVLEDLNQLDSYLNFRTFIAGYSLSLADIAVFGALKGNPLMGSVLKNEVCINVSRWYNLIASDKKIQKVLETITKDIANAKKSKNTGKKQLHQASFKINLPNAKVGQVVTRFPPEPSGYLHIGHVKAAILNEYFARAYKGTLIIRFDDTNPTKEKIEFQDSIIEDLAWLGIKGDKITYSSDYFDELFEQAIKLIKEGKAYCDDTPLEKMRQERMDGIASSRRERSVEENLKIFTQDMKQGTEEGLKNCLRAKIDYTALNKTLRDPVLYRTNLTPHHRTGTKWKMYPTYDLCVPVVDSIEGVTHSLRTNEYRDRNAQYEWILDALSLRHVDIWDFGRINFVRTLLSKRKLQWFVDKGYVADWDDPRFPTIRGVRRRGMTVDGLRNFIMAQGPSKNIINLDWSTIWALNKKVIDPVAPRFTAIEEEKVVLMTLSGITEPAVELKPKHKKNPAVGDKKVIYARTILIEQEDAASLAIGEEITLMDWGNAIITNLITATTKEGATHISAVSADLNLEGDFRKTTKKITWVADTQDKVKVELVDYDHLICKDKLEEGESFEDFLTPQTQFRSWAYADLNVAGLVPGDVIQFERKGYYRVDQMQPHPQLFTIPDGKTVSRYGSKK